MSRNSQARKAAKQARRRKRLAGRDTRWLAPADAGVDGLADEIAVAAADFDTWMTSRGWVLDAENATDDVVSWVYPPSAMEVDAAEEAAVGNAEESEPVTRVWIAIVGEDEDFPHRVNAVLVGTGMDAVGLYRVTPEALVEGIETLEAYRPGDPRPEFP